MASSRHLVATICAQRNGSRRLRMWASTAPLPDPAFLAPGRRYCLPEEAIRPLVRLWGSRGRGPVGPEAGGRSGRAWGFYYYLILRRFYSFYRVPDTPLLPTKIHRALDCHREGSLVNSSCCGSTDEIQVLTDRKESPASACRPITSSNILDEPHRPSRLSIIAILFNCAMKFLPTITYNSGLGSP
jgi:hypothetical protein